MTDEVAWDHPLREQADIVSARSAGRTVELREVLDFLRNGSVDVSPSIGWDDAADELEAHFGPRKDPHSGCGSDGWGCAAPVAAFDVNCNLGPKNTEVPHA